MKTSDRVEESRDTELRVAGEREQTLIQTSPPSTGEERTESASFSFGFQIL